jgi:hypothetical protein
VEKAWFGLKVYARLNINNIKILYNEKAIVLIGKNLEEKNNYIDFYLCLVYLTEKDIKIENAFGIFTDLGIDMIRRKIKKNFIENIHDASALNLLESNNREAYYTEKENTEELMGIQIEANYPKLTQEELDKEFVNILEVLAGKRKKIKIYNK